MTSLGRLVTVDTRTLFDKKGEAAVQGRLICTGQEMSRRNEPSYIARIAIAEADRL